MAGRKTLFQGKDKSLRYQGIVTRAGATAFERVRKALEKKYGFSISDGDVFEYLARWACKKR